MDGAEVFRAVRRRGGLSQRALAHRSGVALSTVTGVEAGRQQPSTGVLAAVLGVVGLELSVDVPPPDLTDRERAYLRLSLVRRLHLALGGSGRPQYGPRLPRWQQLVDLARVSHVTLHGELALRLWLRGDAPVGAAEVCALPVARTALPDVPDLRVHPACGDHASAPVVVSVSPWQLHADPPADLALRPAFAAQRHALRAAARVLHADAARDDAGRRTRAHRDPSHDAERVHVFHTKRFGQRPMPDATDVRAWRLDDHASLAEWLRSYGYPV